MNLDTMTDVLFEKVEGYDTATLAQALDSFAPFLPNYTNLTGSRVLLKPNLISSRGPQLSCTHPLFLIAVARWFLEQGARVVVGDSPAFGSCAGTLDRRGALQPLQKMGVEIVEFATVKKVTLASGLVVGIAAESQECDLFVNVPKVKAHNQLYVTLAVKNIFGIIKGFRKPMLHMNVGDSHHNFAALLLDLLAVLPPSLTIVDGIEAMHKSGPLDGEPLSLGCMAAAASPVALDTALLAALELPAHLSPVWSEAQRREMGDSELASFTFPLRGPADFADSGFKAPAQLNPVRFRISRLFSGIYKRLVIASRQ